MKNFIQVGLSVCCAAALVSMPYTALAAEDPNVEVQIYATSATNDDLVQLGKFVSGRARLTGTPKNDLDVTLISPDGRLRYGNNATATLALTLPKNNDWVTFQINGYAKSDSVADAVVELRKGSSTGTVKTTAALSVWRFAEPKIIATPTDPYELTDTSFRPAGSAIRVTANIKLLPTGLTTDSPQLRSYKLAIQQNLDGGWNKSQVNGDPRIIQWFYRNSPDDPGFYGAVSGSSYSITSLYKFDVTGPFYDTNDTGPSYPFYGFPEPLSSGETTTSIEDAPQMQGGIGQQYLDPSTNRRVALVIYDRVKSASIREYFHDWLVIQKTDEFNNKTRANLAQTNWNINAFSGIPGNRYAVGGVNGPVTSDPIDNPVSNSEPGTKEEGFEGADTTNFVAP